MVFLLSGVFMSEGKIRNYNKPNNDQPNQARILEEQIEIFQITQINLNKMLQMLDNQENSNCID